MKQCALGNAGPSHRWAGFHIEVPSTPGTAPRPLYWERNFNESLNLGFKRVQICPLPPRESGMVGGAGVSHSGPREGGPALGQSLIAVTPPSRDPTWRGSANCHSLKLHMSLSFSPVSIFGVRAGGCVPEIIKTTHLQKYVAGLYASQPLCSRAGRLQADSVWSVRPVLVGSIQDAGEGQPEPVQMMDLLSPPP